MQIITLDFETYFDDDYTLSKLTTENYVRDPRFEAHGCAFRETGATGSWWLTGNDLRKLLVGLDWSRIAILCHHAQFDGLILSHVYGVRPAAWLDTLSMARLMVGNHISASLASLAKHFDLGTKDVPYDLFRGRHWHELPPDVQRRVAAGACHDVELTWALFQRLARGFPSEEYRVIDTTIRMFTEPTLVADRGKLQEIYDNEENTKELRARELGIDGRDLQSNAKFIELLRIEGIEPPVKAGKNGDIPAIAKTDEFLKELLEHDDDRVRALAEARVGVKSTLTQTRAKRLIEMSQRGPLCVYLNYCGAHTTRWSGGDKLNFQNLPRFPRNVLRKTLQAPERWHLVKLDLSQIECRILNWAAGQSDVVALFAKGLDVYAAQASKFYRTAITKETHPKERDMFKVVELQSGFGSGGPKIARTIRLQTNQDIDDADGEILKTAYRDEHPCVMRYWRFAEQVIKWLATGQSGRWGPLEVADRRIWLPNGCPLIYSTLDQSPEGEWTLATRRGRAKLYGAKLVENVVQAMARVVLSQLMLRVQAAGFRIVLTAHDDLGILVRNDEWTDQSVNWLRQEARRVPAWAPGLPLDADVKVGRTYE